MDELPRRASDAAEVATYVASITTELAVMSHKAGLPTLEHLLEMARLEAENLSRREPGGAD
jgi:hypothetical protein